jgi:hypothetical protein
MVYGGERNERRNQRGVTTMQYVLYGKFNGIGFKRSFFAENEEQLAKQVKKYNVNVVDKRARVKMPKHSK